MPRVARIVVEHVPHHVTQRGSNRQDVFFLDDERWCGVGSAVSVQAFSTADATHIH
jgi:putative transposase